MKMAMYNVEFDYIILYMFLFLSLNFFLVVEDNCFHLFLPCLLGLCRNKLHRWQVLKKIEKHSVHSFFVYFECLENTTNCTTNYTTKCMLTILGVMEGSKCNECTVHGYTQRVCGRWLHMKSPRVMVMWEECVGDGYVGGVHGRWLCV